MWVATLILNGARAGKKHLSIIEMFVSYAHFGQIWIDVSIESHGHFFRRLKSRLRPRHKSQWGNQGPCKGNPHRVGSD